MLLFYLALPFFLLDTILCSALGVVAMLLDRSGSLYHTIFRFWSRSALRLFRVKVAVRGREHLDGASSYIYMPNHSSYLDISVLGAVIPDTFRFILKEELTKIPVFGWALRASPHIIIQRSDARNAMAGIEKAARDIAAGASVVIFPEGTRTKDGRLGEFKRGGFMLATKSGVPIVPVAISGTYALLPRTDWRVKPGRVEVIIGHPISNPMNPDRVAERAIMEETRARVEEMAGESQVEGR
jgi:1-acyl-sn-glycerol-3-phosphate acyltransferase